MVERICPMCQRGNPLENRFCGHCGAALGRNDMVTAQQHALPGPADLAMSNSNTADMSTHLKHVGKAVAMGVVALAAEAGMAWLRRKVGEMQQDGQPGPSAHPIHPAHPSPSPANTVIQYPVNTNQPPQSPAHAPSTSIVSTSPINTTTRIISERVVQIWEHGVLTCERVDRKVWQREEQS